MNGLLPIIRRVRRPLLPPEAAADAKPAAAPAAAGSAAMTKPSGEQEPKEDGQVASSPPAQQTR